jgi:poly(glycerol-phosphate) alpha-glucosyltransferase
VLETRLRDSGELIDGIRLLNLWDWLRDNDLPQDAPGTLDLEKHAFDPLTDDPAHVSTRRGAVELTRARVADGATLQVDHYRLDGTLLATDRRDGPNGMRSIVLCDRAGTPIRSWGSAWGLYRYWLDLLRDGEASFLLVDSKTAANFMATYKRKRAVTMHIAHSSHLSGDVRPLGTLKAERRAVFENLDAFDAVVLLTERQRADVVELLGRHDNLVVVPNGRDLPAAPSRDDDRPASRGIVLASLTARKRVDDALRAVAAARASGAEVTLDVYGEGEKRATVEQVSRELGLDGPVRLLGHRSDARAQLERSSFLLLTSTSEGLPLVLVEAMAAGCIPIAYDIPYGPADLIKDGRNGFLIPNGDVAAAGRAIASLQQMGQRQIARMRREARRRASEFSDLEVTKTWAKAMRDAEKRKLFTWPLRKK